jgi:serine/threonine protein kinase
MHSYREFWLAVERVPKLIAPVDSQASDFTWIIMNWIPGVTLEQFFHERGDEINLSIAVALCRQLLNIVKQFHMRGVIHRDLKPSNIMVMYPHGEPTPPVEQAQLVVIDFGLAWVRTLSLINSNTDDNNLIIQAQQDEDTKLSEGFGNRWYRVPQMSIMAKNKSPAEEEQVRQDRRSPTIDASYVCAFLYWFLAKGYAGKARNPMNQAPHERPQYRDEIDKKLAAATRGMHLLVSSFRISSISFIALLF